MDITEWDDPGRIDGLEGGEQCVLAATDEMMLVHYTLETGATGEPHAHEETTQASFVIEGALELRGVRALEDCRVIDAFAPPLTEYGAE